MLLPTAVCVNPELVPVCVNSKVNPLKHLHAGPTAYPNNAVFVHEFVTNLLTTSFPNMRPQQVQVRGVSDQCVVHIVQGSNAHQCSRFTSWTACHRLLRRMQSKGCRRPPCSDLISHIFAVFMSLVNLQLIFPSTVQACVAGMFEYKDFGAFKSHLRDFLVQASTTSCRFQLPNKRWNCSRQIIRVKRQACFLLWSPSC